MRKVILIATVHKNRGICNSNELLKIIKRIEPEVIYEEVPPSKFTAIYEEGTRIDSLETATIKRYIQNHPIPHFPVDLNIDELIEREFRIEVKKMFNTFDQYQEVQLMRLRHEELTEQLGFSYLNSEKCIRLFEHLHFLEEDILKMFNDEKFSKIYKNWLANLDKRENEMIKQIYSFSSEYNYERALFLVGAEHMKSIMKKISKFEENNKSNLSWDFNYLNK